MIEPAGKRATYEELFLVPTPEGGNEGKFWTRIYTDLHGFFSWAFILDPCLSVQIRGENIFPGFIKLWFFEPTCYS